MLEDAIHEINNHNASGLSFEELYRHAAPELQTVKAVCLEMYSVFGHVLCFIVQAFIRV